MLGYFGCRIFDFGFIRNLKFNPTALYNKKAGTYVPAHYYIIKNPTS